MASINVRVDDDLKARAYSELERLGVTPSELVPQALQITTVYRKASERLRGEMGGGDTLLWPRVNRAEPSWGASKPPQTKKGPPFGELLRSCIWCAPGVEPYKIIIILISCANRELSSTPIYILKSLVLTLRFTFKPSAKLRGQLSFG